MKFTQSLILGIALLVASASAEPLKPRLSQQGWPSSMAEAYHKLNPQKNYAVLLTLLPTEVLDYRTSQSLKKSINVRTFMKNYHPGHQMIGWKCQIDQTAHHSMIGFNGDSEDYSKTMLKNGWGFTSMISIFKDGYLESPSELDQKMNALQEALVENPDLNKYVVGTAFEITESECRKMIDELYFAQFHPNKPLQKFSLFAKMNSYQGAVCNSFAFHLLNQIESLQPIIPHMSSTLSISKYLFRKGLDLPSEAEVPDQILSEKYQKPMSLLRLFLADWSPSSVDGSIDIDLINPEFVIFWQKIIAMNYFKSNSNSSEKKVLKGLERGFWAEDTVLGGESDQKVQKYFKLNENFDPQTKLIHKTVQQSLQNKKIDYVEFLKFPFFIVENE